MSNAGAGERGTILYAVVPGFYAAVERLRTAGDDARPILVGGDPRKRGRVQSVSPEALARGVVPGMSMLDALDRCPDARRVPTDMAQYRQASSVLRAALRREVEGFEAEGLDAAFLDLRDRGDAPADVARSLVARVEADTGLAIAVGGGPSKGVARLAAQSIAGGEVRIVSPGELDAFLDPLPVEQLPGVGPRTAATLVELGAQTVGALRHLPVEVVEEALGNHGLEILRHASGEDREGVKSSRHPASISRDVAFERPTAEADELARALIELARALETNLARHDLRAGRVALRLRLADGSERTRSITVSAGLRSAVDIEAEARVLLERFELDGARVHGFRIALAGLSAAGTDDRQLDLFG